MKTIINTIGYLNSNNRIVIIIFLTLITNNILYSQLPAIQENKASLRNEYYGGLKFHTSGWGAIFTYSKFHTFKTKKNISVEFVSMKHGKEYKRTSVNDERAKGYYYGKLNTLNILRIDRGIKKILYEKKRRGGIEISFNYNYGISVGLIKPVYLEVFKVTGNKRIDKVEERYNPEVHHINNIYGRASNLTGISELEVSPGINLKTSIIFDFAKNRERIKSIEIGTGIDLFYKRIPIMAELKNKYIYPTVFLNFQFGRKKL